jgi:RNA polymerase sigma-70 factor (ECF subfamily)
MMPESLDECALIERARRDPDAFTVLYRHYLNPVYRYLLVRLGNSQDAEDITSKVFTEALDGLIHERYREGGNFAAWLLTIARRRLIDYLRRRPTIQLEEIAVSDPDPIGQIQFSESKTRLHELLSQMDEDKQELLRLRFAGGLSFAEIAALDGRSEAAVKMTVYRALRWLRENWEVDND